MFYDADSTSAMLTARRGFSTYPITFPRPGIASSAFRVWRAGLRRWPYFIHQPCEPASMGLLRKLKQKIRFAVASGYALLPVQGVSRPVFILGCGRSGTTIFGAALSKHKSITYLNEPRHLWFAAYPETDIWTQRAARRKG